MRNIIAEINRLAKMLVALNDVEFNRFKKIFDEKLHDFSVDTRTVAEITVSEIIEDMRSRGVLNRYDTNKEEILGEINESYMAKAREMLPNFLAPLRFINRFLSDRTWNMVKANEIFNKIDAAIELAVRALYIGTPKNLPKQSLLLGEVYDFYRAFQEAAQDYMTSTFETATTSEFNSVVKQIYDIMADAWGKDIANSINSFDSDIKYVLEDLKTAQETMAKNPRYAQQLLDKVKDKSELRFNFHSSERGEYKPEFYKYFIGTNENIPWDEPKFWQLIYNQFNQNFRLPVLNQINAMIKDTGYFLAKHSKDYSKMGADASTRYYEEAHELYGQLVNSYAFLLRRLAGVGIDFNIDDVFAELKTELDKI